MDNTAIETRLDLLERLLDEIDHERFAPTDEGDAVCLFCGKVSPEDGDELHQRGCAFGSEPWKNYRAGVSQTSGEASANGPHRA